VWTRHRLRISAIPCDSGNEIIQGVAKRTKRWLVVLPIDESAGAGLDGCRFAAESNHATAMQSPKQPGRVVAAQAVIARVWVGGRLVQAE
jgi:hypothetical protein